MRGQLEYAIGELEDITGRSFNYHRLAEVMKISNETAYWWRKACFTARTCPSPLNGFDMFNYMALVVCIRGKKEGRDLFKLWCQELEERAEKGLGPWKEGEEKYRVIWDGIACWVNLSPTYKILKKYGVNVVTSLYPDAWTIVYETNDIEGMAKAYSYYHANRCVGAMLEKTIARLEERALNPAKAVALIKEESGKGAVGCFPIYTPEEIVYAGGFVPVGLWGGKTEIKMANKFLQGFCCSIMRANMELGMRGVYDQLQAIIMPGLCDTLKCIIDNWKTAVPQVPMIGMIYPQARWTKAPEDYLTAELKRVRSAFEKETHTLITDQKVEEAFAVYEEYRAAMRQFVEIAKDYPITINAKRRHLLIKAAYFMDKKIYTAELQKVIQGLRNMDKEEFHGVKVVTTGLLAEPSEILNLLRACEISIAADDIAQESRQFRTLARKEGNVWDKMMGRLIHQRDCAFLAEQKKSRGQMLIDLVKDHDAQAVVVCMMKFCDPEEFDYPVYKAQLEQAGIPILYLELDQQIESFEQVRTRIQSFAEMLTLC